METVITFTHKGVKFEVVQEGTRTPGVAPVTKLVYVEE